MQVAAIGYGAFGAFVLSALKELPEVTLYAVAGRRAEKVRTFAEQMGIPRWTTDWRTLVSDPQVDIVCVLTPPSTHAEIAIAAAQNGKHLFIEKPLALTPEEADGVIAAVQASGVRAVVNHIMRYHPIYAWLKERIASGELGGVRKVWFVNFASREGLAPEHWFWDERQSGGVLVEHGVHFFHLFAWLLDEVPDPVATFAHAPFEAWSVVHFARQDAFGSFYHCFDRVGALERNFGGIALEHGFATFEGWLPLSLRLELLRDGTIVVEERQLPMDKGRLYRRLVQAAFSDLLAAIQDPQHQIAADLASAREALRVAWKAKKKTNAPNLKGVLEFVEDAKLLGR